MTGLELYTLTHTLISLVGIVAGLVVIRGFLRATWLDGWNRIFLLFTVLTSVTGFFFPYAKITPAIILGIISLVVAVPTVLAWAPNRLAGGWRSVYVIGSVVLEYFNVFVLVVQLFAKVPALHALAPNGNEPAFGAAQGVVLLLFVYFGWRSVKNFHPAD